MQTSELFTTATGADTRVRFCPSPTGTPHVGLVRTALFNWAYARHTGGTFVFRIEDTDAERDSEESYEQILEALTWLGLDWDEGPEKGGPHGPYRQSERGEIYQGIIDQLLAAGYLYESYVTAEEMAERNREMGRDEKQGYDNHERDLTEEQKAAYRAEGRTPALRLKVPDGALDFVDLVRGPISFPAGSTIDFVVVRPNGKPLYTFVNPVDDALMGITHVLRGEDLLSSTPRQIALYHALIEVGVAEAINAEHLRALEPGDFLDRTLPYLERAGLIGSPASDQEREILAAVLPHVQPRVGLLGEVPDMVAFLFTKDDELVISEDARSTLKEGAAEVLDATQAALEGVSDWTTPALEDALRTALVEGLELSPRHAFTPVRVAVSGRRVSPPLFESMEILGRESTLARLSALRQTL